MVNKGEQETEIPEIDSLIELFKENIFSKPEEAKANLDQAWLAVLKYENKNYQAKILLFYSDYYCSNGNYELADKLAIQAQNIYRSKKNISGLGSSYNGLGKSKLLSGDYKKALTSFLKAADLFEQAGDLHKLAAAYHNIGGVHFDQGADDQALEYWNKSLKLEIELKDTLGIISSLNDLGAVHYSRREFEEGLQMMHQSLELAEMQKDSSQISFLLMNIGAQYHNLDQPDSAKYYYKQSLVLLKQVNERHNLALQYVNLGRLECDYGEGNKAVAYFDTCLALGYELNSPLILKHAYGGLADGNNLAGNYKEAFTWLDKWYSIKDSLNGEETKLQINEIQEKYKGEQKDKEIAKLEQKEFIASAMAEKRKLWLIYTVSVSAFLLALIFLFIAQRRVRNKQKTIELEHKALRSQMNPHFIFNSLGAIQQMYMSGETDLANDYMGDFGTLMRKILQNSGMSRISIKEELEMLTLYLELEKGRTNGLLEYAIEVDERIDQFGTQIPPLVIQPFVENAIWHGILPKKSKGKIGVTLTLETNDDSIICVIEDNGVGMNNETKTGGYESKGMKITEQRLGSKIKVESLNPGTRITIKIHT